MPAFRDNRVRIRFLANNTRKRYTLQHLILIPTLILLLLLPLPPVRRSDIFPARRHRLSALSPDVLPVLVEFPALFVILAGVQELAAVAEPAEAGLFVVFADVGGEVGDGDGADVGGGFDGADLAGWGVGVFGDEGLVVGGAFVGAAACLGSGGGIWRAGAGFA